jgi:hypothetical protein
VGEVALGVEGVDEHLEGDVLVGVGGEGAVADPEQELEEGRVVGEVGAQDEGVDEEADDGLQLGAGAVGDGGAYGDVGLAGVAGEEGLEGGQEGHEEGSAVLLAEGAQGVGELRGELEGEVVAAERLEGRPGAVGGQLEEGRGTGEGLGPEVKLALEGRALEPGALPGGEVGVLEGEGWERGGAALPEGVVEGGHLPQEDA